MKTLLQTLKVTADALRMLRIIAGFTGETQYVVIERLLAKEFERVLAEELRKVKE